MPQDHSSKPELDDDDIRYLSTQLRGVRQARVRFLAASPAYELEVVELLLALGVSATTERLGAIAPQPRRRFGIRYKDGAAIITVAPDARLLG
ncbi:hypothetical protein M3484_23385 [Pseudomonas sp. GX19020]|uniref:hypothetical protein n=1 Tax=Pseudomonas sp. GX19020 TaxID=2942277 RepID=UPI0020199530|nr:hypothetical protein [Pseudomonas sp. GX19020]MCL4069503.1 hypothetical protein [Pseudomonas sp. GX19020]